MADILVDSIPQGADVYLGGLSDSNIIGRTPFYYPRPLIQTNVTFRKTNTSDIYATVLSYLGPDTPNHLIMAIYNWSVPTFDFAIIPRSGEPYNGSMYIGNTKEILIGLYVLSGPSSGELINMSCTGFPINSTFVIDPIQTSIYSILTINTSLTTPPGNYILNITGTSVSNGITHTIQYTLTVLSTGCIPITNIMNVT